MNRLLKIWNRFETWFNKTFGRYFTNARKKDIRDDEKAHDNRYDDVINEYPTIQRWNEDLKKLR